MTQASVPRLDDIESGWPATVDVETACSAFGVSRSYGYELVARDEFPARVIKVGGRRRVITASIIAALKTP